MPNCKETEEHTHLQGVPLERRTHCNIVSLLPKLEILAVDADETQQDEWEAEDDVKGGPLDPREVKAAHQREIQ